MSFCSVQFVIFIKTLRVLEKGVNLDTFGLIFLRVKKTVIVNG